MSCLCVGVSKLVYFLLVLRYASQPLDAYVRFLPLPEGFFGTLSVGVGVQGERGELRCVCFFVVVLCFSCDSLFEGTDGPSSLCLSLPLWG